jgi:hypothetical protein
VYTCGTATARSMQAHTLLLIRYIASKRLGGGLADSFFWQVYILPTTLQYKDSQIFKALES